jgi:phosphate transport system permease protein
MSNQPTQQGSFSNDHPAAYLPTGEAFRKGLAARQQRSSRWRVFFLAANLVAIAVLLLLFFSIINQAFGLIVVEYTVDPTTLSNRPLQELSEPELVAILKDKVGRNGMRVLVRDFMIGKNIDPDRLTTLPMSELLPGKTLPEGVGSKKFSQVTVDDLVALLSDNLTQQQLYNAILEGVVRPEYVASWNLIPSLFNRAGIETWAKENHPKGELRFHSWINWDFISSELASTPATAGLRTALVGSLFIIVLTILIALPLGVGAALYLEEYATHNRIETLIETNIRNLAGVPSIIYGMLGLAVFVRALEPLTSGAIFGVTDSNGRTIIAAAFTMALLILPVVIINAQEAIRAVPYSIREASYGVGATKWQTIWRQVLPAAFPGILTGLILSVSRAVGETAPLIVVGGLTFVTIDPNSIFSKFTVVPIQVYSWISEPNLAFKNVAAAAIIVLLVLLLSLNTIAIVLRQRFSRRLRA